MITRISAIVAAIAVSGGILLSVGSPAEAKGAGLSNGLSIKREARLIRIIRVKLAKRRVDKVLAEAAPASGIGRAVRSAEPVELVRTKGKAKRSAEPVEAVQSN